MIHENGFLISSTFVIKNETLFNIQKYLAPKIQLNYKDKIDFNSLN